MYAGERLDQATQLRNVIKAKSQNNIKPARVITITSGKGGVGKSNLAVNLAVQLRKQGKRVIILDADFGLANIEVMFGVIPTNNLSSMLYNGKSIKEVISPGPMDIGFISGGNGVVGLNNLTREQIMLLVRNISELNELADVIIIDTGAGISDQVLQFVLASPEVLLVSTPDPSSLTDSYSLIKALYSNPNFVEENTKVHIVSNRVASAEEGKMLYEKLNSVVKQFLNGNINYLGMIPQSTSLEKAVRQQKIASLNEPNSDVAKAYNMLTMNLLDGTSSSVPVKRGISQMFSQLLNRRR